MNAPDLHAHLWGGRNAEKTAGACLSTLVLALQGRLSSDGAQGGGWHLASRGAARRSNGTPPQHFHKHTPPPHTFRPACTTPSAQQSPCSLHLCPVALQKRTVRHSPASVMFEATFQEGATFKRIIDAMRDLATDATFDCSPSGITLQVRERASLARPRTPLLLIQMLTARPHAISAGHGQLPRRPDRLVAACRGVQSLPL